MLINFDHVTLVVNRKEAQRAINDFKQMGYVLALEDDHAFNIPTKLDFMKYKDPTHGLYLMKDPQSKAIPVEIIAYEHTTDGKSLISYSPCNDSFSIHTSNIEKSKQLLLTLGCVEDNEKIRVKGVFDITPFTINLVQDIGVEENLDNVGYCCPTLFVTPGNQTKVRLEDAGYYCTEPCLFNINGKSMYIFFVKGNSGELIEIVTNKL